MGRLSNISSRYGTTSPTHYNYEYDPSTQTTTIPVKFEEQAQQIPANFEDRIKELPAVIRDFYGRVSGSSILYGTTEYWDSTPTRFSKNGYLYVYTDKYSYERDGETIIVPAMKIGRDNSYLIDLPFLDEYAIALMEDHIKNTQVHIQEGEREGWNNKVTAREVNGTLILENN
jgi:hypothetical protein